MGKRESARARVRQTERERERESESGRERESEKARERARETERERARARARERECVRASERERDREKLRNRACLYCSLYYRGRISLLQSVVCRLLQLRGHMHRYTHTRTRARAHTHRHIHCYSRSILSLLQRHTTSLLQAAESYRTSCVFTTGYYCEGGNAPQKQCALDSWSPPGSARCPNLDPQLNLSLNPAPILSPESQI